MSEQNLASTPEGNDQEQRRADDRQDDLCAHIFAVSAALVGVCLTVVGVIRAVAPLTQLRSLADDLLAINSGVFLLSCITAYHALRSRDVVRRRRAEKIADNVFIIGLCLMSAICGLIAYEVI